MKPFRILLALDKFKGTFSSLEAAIVLEQALREGWREEPHADQSSAERGLEIEIWPVSDGGQGLLQALQVPLQLELKPVWVSTPHGTWTQAQLGWQPKERRMVIESSQATGLHLIPPESRHPLQLNSAGLGHLLRAAAPFAPQEILIGLGSSGTIDGGMGLAHTLGYGLWDATGQPLLALPAHTSQLARITFLATPVFHPNSQSPRIIGLCDVNNPVLGTLGGVRVYGPQKGASEEDLDLLERAMAHWAERLVQDLDLPTSAKALLTCPGAGAAGGLGMGLKALLGAELKSGAQWLLSVSGLEQALQGADLLITGEGQFDQQSGFGKWPAQVIQTCLKQNIPVYLITGQPLEGPLPQGVIGASHLLEKQPHATHSPALSVQALHALGCELGRRVKCKSFPNWSEFRLN